MTVIRKVDGYDETVMKRKYKRQYREMTSLRDMCVKYNILEYSDTRPSITHGLYTAVDNVLSSVGETIIIRQMEKIHRGNTEKFDTKHVLLALLSKRPTKGIISISTEDRQNQIKIRWLNTVLRSNGFSVVRHCRNKEEVLSNISLDSMILNNPYQLKTNIQMCTLFEILGLEYEYTEQMESELCTLL